MNNFMLRKSLRLFPKGSLAKMRIEVNIAIKKQHGINSHAMPIDYT